MAYTALVYSYWVSFNDMYGYDWPCPITILTAAAWKLFSQSHGVYVTPHHTTTVEWETLAVENSGESTNKTVGKTLAKYHNAIHLKMANQSNH